MIKKALVFAVAAACLTSGAAFAQSSDYRNDRNDGDQRGRYEHRDNNDRADRSDRYDRRDHNDRQYGERRDYGRQDGYNRSNSYDARSYGYSNGYSSGYGNGYGNTGYGGQQRYRMQRGERLSQYYRGDQYVVSDWRTHRLYAPQRGYQWVQSGNDYALVAIATGIIASVLLNH